MESSVQESRLVISMQSPAVRTQGILKVIRVKWSSFFMIVCAGTLKDQIVGGMAGVLMRHAEGVEVVCCIPQQEHDPKRASTHVLCFCGDIMKWRGHEVPGFLNLPNKSSPCLVSKRCEDT